LKIFIENNLILETEGNKEMIIKYSNNLLTKIEELMKEAGFKIRYERGTFKSGSCIIEENKVIVINKFASLDTKINFLLDVIKKVPVEEERLNEKSRTFYQELKQTVIQF
jgi:hypothetical protein